MTNRLVPLAWLALAACVAMPGAALELETPPGAFARVISPTVLVAPDAPSWTYAPGEPVTFTVHVLADKQPLKGARITYRVGPERFEGSAIEAEVPPGGLEIAAGTLEEPGFLRCLVDFEHEGRSYHALATVGFAPERIEPTQSIPADFDAFWQRYLGELAGIPLAATRERIPEACTAEVNVYRIRYQTWGYNQRADHFYGILSEPSKPGQYPAVLQVPGAGVRPYAGDVGLAAQGFIVLQIGIHGIPVDLPQPLYEDLRDGALGGYPAYNLDRQDRYYYLRVYLGCVRANDYLASLENWDGRNLIVAGGSQGGQLAIVTSALDPRVTATVANYPAYCDVTGYLHNRAGGWPHIFADPQQQTEAKVATSAYFDTVNFARRLHAPISVALGYNDETCPPTSMFAAYNVITAPKELWLQLDMGHSASPEFSARHQARILAQVKPVQ